MKIIANEPAFPTDSAHQSGPSVFHFSGLTIRAHFAAVAMQGLLSGFDCESGLPIPSWPGADHDSTIETTLAEKVAKRSVQFADALIAELNKGAK